MKAGDLVEVNWLGKTMTARLISHPNKPWVRVRTSRNTFSVPLQGVRPSGTVPDTRSPKE